MPAFLVDLASPAEPWEKRGRPWRCGVSAASSTPSPSHPYLLEGLGVQFPKADLIMACPTPGALHSPSDPGLAGRKHPTGWPDFAYQVR